MTPSRSRGHLSCGAACCVVAFGVAACGSSIHALDDGAATSAASSTRVVLVPEDATWLPDVSEPAPPLAVVDAAERDRVGREGVVLVPQVPRALLDIHGGRTTTEYVTMTVRFLETMGGTERTHDVFHGTRRSTGRMAVLHLTAPYPTPGVPGSGRADSRRAG